MPTEEQLAKLKEQVETSEQKLEEFVNEIKLAEKAGFDMSSRRSEADQLADKIRRVRRAYGV